MGLDFGNVPAWVSAGSALASIGFALWASRSNEKAKVSAKEAQEDRQRVAEESASALGRMAALQEAQAAKYVPPWRIEPQKNYFQTLFNDGDETAYGVEVETDFSMGRQVCQGEVDARSSITFQAPFGFGGDGYQATVRWRRSPSPEAEVLVWRAQLHGGSEG